MKKILLPFMALLMCLSFNSFSQKKNVKPIKKQSPVEGIGVFKIKKTSINIIDSIKSSGYNLVKVSKFGDQYDYIGKRNVICELIPDTTEEYSSLSDANLCSKSRVFYIPEMEISGITLNELILTFFNGTLIKIKCDYSSELFKAFELKYGSSTSSQVNQTYKCIVFGNIIKYPEVTYLDKWFNKDIEVLFYIGSYRDSKCNKQSVSFVSISSEPLVSELEKCNDLFKNKIRKRKESENIEKYKKL
jgi:hypothetical protein